MKHFLIAFLFALSAMAQPTGFTSIMDTRVLMRDSATGNANTNAHGFLRKLSGRADEVIAGDGQWRKGPVEINVKDPDYSATGDGVADDTAEIQAALDAAAAAGGGGVVAPKGTYKITAALNIPSGVTLSGEGKATVIHAVGNFRPLSIVGTEGDPLENIHLKDLRLTFASGGANQSGIIFNYARDCSYANIIMDSPDLNGVEILNSQRIDGNRVTVLEPAFFGIFYYNTTDSTDTDCYIYRPVYWAHQIKSSKRVVSRNIRVIEPQSEYGLYIWTGNSAGVTPGPLLTEDCGYENPYVLGATTSKHLIYINASPRCFVRGGTLIRVGNGWAPLAINATSFYNEGAAMTGDATSGSAALLNVTNASQLTAGDRIFVVGLTGNWTVASVAGSTVTLTANANATVSGAVIGRVSKCDDTVIDGLTIVGDTSLNVDNIGIAGTSGDALTGVVFRNVKSSRSGNYNLNVSAYANVTVIGGSFKDSITREISLSTGAELTAIGVEFANTTNALSVGIVAANGAFFRGVDCVIRDFGGTGVTSSADGDRIHLSGGEIKNCGTAAAILFSNSRMEGVRITNIREWAGSFNAAVRVSGSGTTISKCVFVKGASTKLDKFIGEQASATGNSYTDNYFDPAVTGITLATSSLHRTDVGKLRILSGVGTPEGVATAPIGSIYLRTDGGAATSFYVKESTSGNTGWVAK